MKIFHHHHHHHHHVEFALVTCAERMRNTGHREKVRIHYPSCLTRQLSSASSPEASISISRVMIIKLKNLTRLTENLHLDNFKYNLKFLSLFKTSRIYR